MVPPLRRQISEDSRCKVPFANLTQQKKYRRTTICLSGICKVFVIIFHLLGELYFPARKVWEEGMDEYNAVRHEWRMSMISRTCPNLYVNANRHWTTSSETFHGILLPSFMPVKWQIAMYAMFHVMWKKLLNWIRDILGDSFEHKRGDNNNVDAKVKEFILSRFSRFGELFHHFVLIDLFLMYLNMNKIGIMQF